MSEEIVNNLSPVEKARGRRWLLATAVAGILPVTLCHGRILDAFLLSLGWNAGNIGDLNAVIMLAGFTPLLIGPFVPLLGKRRLLHTFNLALFAPIALLAVLGGSFFWADGLAFPCIAAFWIIVMGGNAFWFPTLQDNTDESNRGGFFGRMRMSWSLAMLVFSLLSAWFIASGPGSPLRRFQIMFILAAVSLLIRHVFVRRVKVVDKPAEVNPGAAVSAALREIWTHPTLRPLTLIAVMMGVSQGLALPYYGVFLKNSLGFSESRIALSQAFFVLLAPLAHLFWGFASDRFGNRPVMHLATGLFAAAQLCLLFLTGNTLFEQWVFFGFAAAVGISLAGRMMAYTRAMLNASEGHDQAPTIIAVFQALVAGAAALSTVCCARLLGIEAVTQWVQQIGPVQLDAYRLFFLVAALVGAGIILQARRLPETHSFRAADVIGPLLAQPIRTLFDVYAIRRPLSEQKRSRMVRRLGGRGSALAEETVLDALSDPSYEVRSSAVESLRTMQPGPRIVEALIRTAKIPGIGIRSKCYETLGELALTEDFHLSDELTREVIAFLSTSGLDDPSTFARAQAVRALGKLKAFSLADRIETMMHDANQSLFVRVSCAWSLSRMEHTFAGEDIYAFYLTLKPGPPKREVLIGLGNLIGKSGEYYVLRRSIHQGGQTEIEDWLRQLRRTRRLQSGQMTLLRELIQEISEGRDEEVLARIRDLCREYPHLNDIQDMAGRVLWALLERQGPSGPDESFLAVYITAMNWSNDCRLSAFSCRVE